MPDRRVVRTLGATAAAVALIAQLFVAPMALAADAQPANPGFESANAAGAPTGWAVWYAAGAGTSAQSVVGAGPEGSRALVLSADSTDDRIAVTQTLPYPYQGEARYLTISFDQKAQAIAATGWRASVRVQAVNASGAQVLFANVGQTGGTHEWKQAAGTLLIPATAASIKIEPMLDGNSGQMLIDNVHIAYSAKLSAVTPTARATGEIDLSWTTADETTSPRVYDIHRSTVADFTPTAATLVRSVPDTKVAEDATTAPATRYYYRVVEKDIQGNVLGMTPSAGVTTPTTFADDQRTNVMTATTQADGVRLAWRLAAGVSDDLDLYGGPAQVVDGDLTGATQLAPLSGRAGAVTLPAAEAYALIRPDGSVAAAARTESLAHPRLWATDERLAKVRRVIAVPGEPQRMWDALRARVDGGLSASPNPYGSPGWGEGEARFAAEAALVYLVTGDAAYAAKAYTGIVAVEPKLALGTLQPLENANVAPALAQAYDWAFNGLTEQQRADANRILSRVATELEVAVHPNMDAVSKSSNWVGVTRGAELALRLATRGDGWFDLGESRIPMLVDQLRRHLDEGYTDTGWSQEGLEYTNYTLSMALPGIYGAEDAGITALRTPFEALPFTNLFLHSLANTPQNNRLQWGVGGPNGRIAAAAMIAQSVPGDQRAAWIWHFMRSVGSLGSGDYAGTLSVWPLLGWPEGVAPLDPDDGPAELTRALMDDEAGAYQFRGGYDGPGDVLVGLTNRNTRHLGWEGLETFGISLTSNGVTWARQPAKSLQDVSLYSKPLIDGRPEDRSIQGVASPKSPGLGATVASEQYDGQGGGYLKLDGSANYAVDSAVRESVVDLRPGGGVDAVIAIRDVFADDVSHVYDWQLSPEAQTTITLGDGSFTFQKNGAWMKGWILDKEGATVTVNNGALRVTRQGTAAEFRIVLAVGSGTVTTATPIDGSRLSLAGTTYDLLGLSAFDPVGPPQ